VYEQLVETAMQGATGVLWLLVILSLLSVAIMLERAWFFWRRRVDIGALSEGLWQGGSSADRQEAAGRAPLPLEIAVAAAGLRHLGDDRDRCAAAMESERARLQGEYERNLAFLGTLGNNAPFVGLFGTVLGIMRAFHDLGATPSALGTQAVMRGISEALLATAIGLLVALPAVFAFNYFQRRLRTVLGNAERLAHLILGRVGDLASDDAGESDHGR
jgi:biopolymer transport protein ExbB